MNRKEGIDYFPVKCAADNAIELVTAECYFRHECLAGVTGRSIV